MRQLVGTIVLFALISCAAATEALDDDGSSAGAITMAEVTVEGSPEAIDLDEPTGSSDALKDTKITLAAPYLEVRAIDVKTEDGGSTKLAVRTVDGWRELPDTFLSYFEEDPGCPSIERENAITEIRVERDALVVVTASDREWMDEDRSGPLVTSSARACRELDGEMTCGEPTVIDAKLSLRAFDDESSPAIEKTFVTKYWVDADGEIETERPFEESSLVSASPGT